MGRRLLRGAAAVLALIVVAGCGGSGRQASPAQESPTARFLYDAAGRLAAVQGTRGTTAVYRYDEAGNRVAVQHVRSTDFDPGDLRTRPRSGPRVGAVSPRRVTQGATVTISGTGFDADPTGDVVRVGGALGRVVSARPSELQVQLPPVATPGPVTVSTASGRAMSRDDVVVTPAGVDPGDVTGRVRAEVGKTAVLRAIGDEDSTSLLTFRGTAGATVQLRLAADACDTAEVGLAGPTGTIIEAGAGDASWCDRGARLPMTGTYTATISHAGDLRATVTSSTPDPVKRLTHAPVARATPQPSDPPPRAGPADFPVDLSSGLLDTEVTDLALGGSGAVDLTRTFSTGDPDLPALAPEEPLARHWSLGASLALEPSMSYSYLDLVLPDGQRLPCRRVTEGAPEPDGAVFEPSGGLGAGAFAGSQISYTGSGWELRTRAGMVVGFGRTGSPLRMAWIRSPDGRTARFIRAPDDDGSPDGDLVGVISEDGQWARLTHDSEHRITSATNQVGDQVSYRYARPARAYADLLVAVTYSPAGGRPSTVRYRYEPDTGRLRAVTDGRRDRVRFAYDDAGRVTREQVLAPGFRGTNAGEWRYSYDVGRRRARIPGRSDSVTLPQIDRVTVRGPGVRRTVTFANGRWVRDSSGGDTVRADRQPGRATPTRGPGDTDGVFVDALGRLAASRSAGGAVTRFGYDAHDRLTSITDPGGAVTELGYTAYGDIASVSDASGTTHYTWNSAGQQTSETDPLGRRQRWRYDGDGRLVRSRDARGVVSTFGYDRAGRLDVARYGVRPHGPPASRVDYSYDRAGRLVVVRDWSAEAPARLRYDKDGRVVREQTEAGVVTARYDAAGHRTLLGLPGGLRARTDYRGDGLPDFLRLSGPVAEVGVAVHYDHGRLTGLDLPHGVRGRFAYRRGQLSALAYTRAGHTVADQRVGRDAAGRVSVLRGDLGRPALPHAQPRADFDAAHQLTRRAAEDGNRAERWAWDRAGHLLRDGSHRYTWDERGRLVAVVGPGGRTTYGYDALGRRTTATTAGQTVRYVHDGDAIVQQVDADGARTTYLRGPDGTPLASTTAGGAGVTTLLPDAFGNIGASVAPGGTTTGYSYDPFGVPGSSNHANVPGFRGLLTDPSGLVQMGARTYDAGTGRFLSRDSWGIGGGDTDPYRYALGAPTVYTDPSGHAAECVGIALGWAMSVLGPGGGWDDYDALEGQVDSGQISEHEWSVKADKVSHDLWAGFDVVANVCGTSAIGSSAAALPLLGPSRVGSRVLGSLADDAVAGAVSTRRIGQGFGGEVGVSPVARDVVERLLAERGVGASASSAGIGTARFAQRGFSETFGGKGLFGGQTIDAVADALRSGALPPKAVPINVVVRHGTMLISNTRSAQALTRAGIPRSLWNVQDQTGVSLYESLVSRQLRRNGLDDTGVDLP